MLGKRRQKKKGVAENEMVRYHHYPMDMNLSKLCGTAKDREPGVLHLIGSQIVRHYLVTEQQQHCK